MTCPKEYAALVDAAVGCPFSSVNSPIGIWGRNGRGNVFLTEQDYSFHYFNTDGGYFHQKLNNDRKGSSIYNSPAKDRYYNPSVEELKPGSYLIGKYWETGKEKMCYRNPDGSLSLTIRRYVTTEDLQRYRVAVYLDDMGSQRLVEVNERGIYLDRDQRLIGEIRFWLASNVPVGYLDGPLLVDDLPFQNRFVTPPPGSPNTPTSHSEGTKSLDDDDTPSASCEGRSHHTSASEQNIKEEVEDSIELADLPRLRSQTTQLSKISDSLQHLKLETLPKDGQKASGSAIASMSKLSSARKSLEVKHGRVTRSVTKTIASSAETSAQTCVIPSET